MKRPQIIELMETVQPALANNQMIPVLNTYWFGGKELMAYSGRIAISVLCETPFKGAVPPTLLSLLKTSTADTDIEFTTKGDTLHVKAASSKFKLGMMPPEDFAFKMPKTSEDTFPCDAGRFMQALDFVMHSIGNDTSSTDFMGVTLIADDKLLHMFASDRRTLSHAKIKLTGKASFKRAILPTEFCREVLRIGNAATELYLDITDKHAMFEFDGVLVYGQLHALDRPQDFVAVANKLLHKDAKAAMGEIPERLPGMLDRAVIITSGAVDKTKTKISVDAKGIMAFRSVSERGECDDSYKFEQHPPVSVHCDPKFFRDGCDRCGVFTITKDAVIMQAIEDSKPLDLIYFVSVDPA